MLALVHLSAEALTHRPSMATLRLLLSRHQVVLVCARCGPAVSVVSEIRRTVRRHVVALLVQGELNAQERNLIRELLTEGTVPLILTTDSPPDARLVNWVWLRAGGVFVLPAEM